MKTKILFITSIIFILLAINTTAFDIADNDLMFYWDFDEASNPIYDKKENTHGKVNLNCTAGVDFQQAGLGYNTDYTVQFDEYSYCENFSAVPFLDLFNTINQNNWTIALSFYHSGTDPGDRVFFGTYGVQINMGSDPELLALVYETVGDHRARTGVVELRNKNLFIFAQQNDTGLFLWNGTTQYTPAYDNDEMKIVTGSGIKIGSNIYGSQKVTQNSKVGFVAIFNRSLSGEEMVDVIENGIITTNNVVLNNQTALNLTYKPIAIGYNTTKALHENCSLYTNSSGSFAVESTEYNISSGEHLIYYDNDDGHIHYYVECYDETPITSNTHYFYVDTLQPFITTTYPKEDSSTKFLYTDIFYINSTFTDNLALYSFNRTILTGDEQIKSDFTLISGTSYDYYEVIDHANLTNATHTLSLTVCDSHTKKEIPRAKAIIYDDKRLNIQWGKDVIDIEALDDYVQNMITVFNKDRYMIKAIYHTDLDVKTFRLSKEDMVYLPDSQYKGHFVYKNKYWIDFEQEGDVIVSTDLNGDYIIKVENPDNIITFRSVGFLNCNTETYNFEKLSAYPSYNDTNVYNINLIPENTFNTEPIDLTTTAGVLVFALLILIWVIMMTFSEYIKIGAMVLITSIYGFFLGWLIYVSLTSIGGIMFILINLIYAISVMRFLD